ncbi:MAG TPA: methionine--tRNA ligase [Patescibacteria group bacterium]
MKDTIHYPDFDKLDLRVGVIIEAEAPEWSEKLLEFKVDFGPEIGERTILSGIKQWYQPSELLGKKYTFVVNLAERKMGPGVSQGMMMMADAADRPTLLPVPDDVPPGTIVR